MKKSQLYLSLFFLCLSLFSCEKEINLEHLRPTPRLVLNSVAVVGDVVTASVSRTWFFTDDHPNVTIEDAEVHLYVNGQWKEKMIWQEGYTDYNSKAYYYSSYQPVAGDRIKITASKKGFNEVYAETTIPEKNKFLKVTEKLEAHSQWGYISYKNRLNITFQDDPNRRDFYLIQIESGVPLWDWEGEEPVYTGEYHWQRAYADYDEEPLFTSKFTALDKVLGYDWLSGYNGRVFSDDLINGKEYTMRVYVSGHYYYSPIEEEEYLPVFYRVNLYTISEAYYRYLKSLIEMDDDTLTESLAESGLAEPTRIYSNINGGVGILGACHRDSVSVEATRPEY
ncbi:hypothetical protein M2101_002449 [Parabacteroides sp. PM5-20]|uniref:DUF4249 domain-containing protein n=1 Tax=unclassified Parabacteroides TaxID=2649774 RepID=UPI0013D1945E|nr:MULTISPECIES: DUF4249 domain-containing protein [unclassified Parabacteroides]MDH6535758.1 hypothetical protein [Parabacteroides sp. PM5-20]